MRSITKREPFDSFIMATIAVLGLELDLTLRGIGEELKGQTHLDEQYVAKKTILHAVRRQNEVILALQVKILDMAEIEAGLQLTMNNLQKEVGVLRKTAKKVDDMDAMLKVKIPILNHLNETIDVHGEVITRVSTQLSRQSSSLSLFKGETRSSVSELNLGLGDLTKTVKALPSTMRISSRQMRHSAEYDNGGSSYDVEFEGKEVLANIISQQEQRAFLQEDNANRVEKSAERQFSEQKRVQIHLGEEVSNTTRVEGTSVER